MQGIILKSQLFGRAADIGEKVSDTDLKSDDGAIKLASAIFKRDALSQVNRMAEEFGVLLTTSRGENEKLKSFESRFEAQVCRFNESSGSTILPDALLALLLLNNSNVDNNQCVSLLAAVAPNTTDTLDAEALRTAIKYDQVASILLSSDALTNNPNSFGSLHASAATTKNGSRNNTHKSDRISKWKKNSRCAECGEMGHWYNDPECPKNQEKAKDGDDPRNNDRNKKHTVMFN